MPLLLSLLGNKWFWVGLAFLGLIAGVKIQTVRLEHAQTRLEAITEAYATFRAQVKAEGEIAQQRADTQAGLDKANKEKADAEHKTTVGLLNQRISSLRYDREHSGSYGVSTPGPTAGSPDRSCFKSAEFERAISSFVEGAAGIVEGCDAIRTALDSAKLWTKSR